MRMYFSQFFQDTFYTWNTDLDTCMVELIKPSCQENTGAHTPFFSLNVPLNLKEDCTASTHECMTWVQQRSGQWVFRIIKCEHGCCGEVFDQECCSAAGQPQESHVWQTVAAVTAGLLVLTVFVALIVCAVKKNKARERRICSRNRGARGRCNESFSGLEISPPPYSETQCNIFILNSSSSNNPTGRGSNPTGGHNYPTDVGNYSTGGENPTVSDTSPVTNHTSDPPPAYSPTD